jgi:hypothetical protein
LDKSSIADVVADVWSFAMRAGMDAFEKPSLGWAADELAKLAEAVREGLDQLYRAELPEEEDSLRLKPWYRGPAWLLEPSIFGHFYRNIECRTFRSFYEGDVRAVFMVHVADLLASEGRRVTKCARRACEKLFVRRKRGIYCSPACSQKERTQRHIAKLGPETFSERRREYYEKQLRKLTGKPNLTVKRRAPRDSQSK